MNPPQPIPQVDPLYADLRRQDTVRPALIVDVRERDEFADVRVDGTLLVPMSELGARLNEIPRDRPVLVMCAMGGRSANAVGHLLASGWTDVANVAGGITQWERMGLPVTRGPVQPGEGSGAA